MARSRAPAGRNGVICAPQRCQNARARLTWRYSFVSTRVRAVARLGRLTGVAALEERRGQTMESLIAQLLQNFEQGKMTRRQLIQSLALAATAAAGVGAGAD